MNDIFINKMINNCINYDHDLQSKHIATILLGKIQITKFHYNYRRYKTLHLYTGTIHAEVGALKELLSFVNCRLKNLKNMKPLKKLSKYSIVVLRVNSNGKLLNSKPCYHCLQILKKIGISKIYYSTEDGEIEVQKIKNMDTDHYSRLKRSNHIQKS